MRVLSRAQTISRIDRAGKREQFEDDFGGRTPEEYFEEYAYLEPEIWQKVLCDLEIQP